MRKHKFTSLTFNKSFGEWENFLGDSLLVTAMLNRFAQLD
ncbi:ATP-binding protein [Caldifermentibacillus hisashii]